MNKTERNEYIDMTCNQKKINLRTQKYIKQYIRLNEKLFGDFLDIDEVTKRLLKNLRYSIKGIDILKRPSAKRKVLKMIRVKGAWLPENHSIYVNPIMRIKGLFSKDLQRRISSTIMHEMDHCATQKYVHISKDEEKEYINIIENNIIEQIEDKEQRKRYINKIKNSFYEINGRLPLSGIEDIRQSLKTGIELRSLNEGITAWKQEMYDRVCGIEPYTGYKNEKKVAKFIAEMIGKEKLIKMHFNNDYENICKEFFKKTGEDLNDLVEELNKRPINTKGKEMIEYSNNIDKAINRIRKNTKNDKSIFKYDVDTEKNNQNTQYLYSSQKDIKQVDKKEDGR